MVGCVTQAVCVGSKDTVTPMVSILLAAVLNFIGDLILVPKTGIVGAAIATAVSQYAAAGMLIIVLWQKKYLGRPVFAARKDGGSASRVPKSFKRDVWPFFRYGPFMFCCLMKLILHNSAAM